MGCVEGNNCLDYFSLQFFLNWTLLAIDQMKNNLSLSKNGEIKF